MHDLLFDQIRYVLLLKSDCENQGIYVTTNNEMMELIKKLPTRGIRSLYFLWENFKFLDVTWQTQAYFMYC